MNKQKSVFLVIISALFFSLMSAFVKLSGNIPIAEKVFFRNLISLGIAFYILKKKGASFKGKRENRKFLFYRAFLGTTGMFFKFYSISNMYLADSTMLNRLSSFFVTIFAVLFLKEKLSKIQIPLLFIVFFSALLVIKPKFNLEGLPALAGLLSAITAGGVYTIISFLKNKEDSSTIVLWFSALSMISSLPFLLGNFVVPSSLQLFYLLATGVCAAGGQFAITSAYKYAPANEVSIYSYLNIIFAVIIGFFIWGELPDTLSIIGGILIIGVGVINFMYNQKKLVLKKA